MLLLSLYNAGQRRPRQSIRRSANSIPPRTKHTQARILPPLIRRENRRPTRPNLRPKRNFLPLLRLRPNKQGLGNDSLLPSTHTLHPALHICLVVPLSPLRLLQLLILLDPRPDEIKLALLRHGQVIQLQPSRDDGPLLLPPALPQPGKGGSPARLVEHSRQRPAVHDGRPARDAAAEVDQDQDLARLRVLEDALVGAQSGRAGEGGGDDVGPALFGREGGVGVPGYPGRVFLEGLHHVELRGEVVDLLPLEVVEVAVLRNGGSGVGEALEDAAGQVA